METLGSICVVTLYVAGLLVLILGLIGLLVYQPSFARRFRRNRVRLLKLASRSSCLPAADIVGEILWVLEKIAEQGDERIQGKLNREEYSLLLKRVGLLRECLEEITRSGFRRPFQSRLRSLRSGVRTAFSQVLEVKKEDFGFIFSQACRQSWTPWADGLPAFHCQTPVFDFQTRCLALCSAAQTVAGVSESYFDGFEVRKGQLLLVQGRLCRVCRVYNVSHARFLELYDFIQGVFRYLTIPTPFSAKNVYLDVWELSGKLEAVPEKVVVLEDPVTHNRVVIVVSMGNEESWQLISEIFLLKGCWQQTFTASDRLPTPVRTACWGGESERVSAFWLDGDRQVTVLERRVPVLATRDREREYPAIRAIN